MSSCADAEHDARPAKRSRQAPGKASARDAEAARARDLAAREDAVAAREAALSAREAAATARELAASARETAVVMREEALEAREVEAATREEEAARREDGASSREDTAAMREGAAAAREHAARAREREAAAREEAARARIAAAEALERAATLKEQQAARVGCAPERLPFEVPVPRGSTPSARQLPTGPRHLLEVPRARDAPDRRSAAPAAPRNDSSGTAPGSGPTALPAATHAAPGVGGTGAVLAGPVAAAHADALHQGQQVEDSERELGPGELGSDGDVNMEPLGESGHDGSDDSASGSPLAAGTPPLLSPPGSVLLPHLQQQQQEQQQEQQQQEQDQHVERRQEPLSRHQALPADAGAAVAAEFTHATQPAQAETATVAAGTAVEGAALATGSSATGAAAAPAKPPSSSGLGRAARGGRAPPLPGGSAPPPTAGAPPPAAPAPPQQPATGVQAAQHGAPRAGSAAAIAAAAVAAVNAAAAGRAPGPAATAAAPGPAAAAGPAPAPEPMWGREQNAVLLELLPKKGMGLAALQEVHERLGGRFGLDVITKRARALMALMLEEATG